MSAAGDDSAWSAVRSGILDLLVGLKVGEVIELALDDRFYLQLGRVPDQLWLLASGPATPDLDVGELDPAVAERLRALGFRPPDDAAADDDDDKASWWYAVDVPADPVHLEFFAEIAVEALRAAGVERPSDVVWSGTGSGPDTELRAGRLGIPRSPHQAN